MAVIDAAVLERHGIKPDEYERILELMGREPNLLELGLFSVMWSEHCSYKSSRVHLKTLPTTGPRVLQGPGENAGAVDIGDGMAAVFKIESHNHPSFIEPYQGAATGVGGIGLASTACVSTGLTSGLALATTTGAAPAGLVVVPLPVEPPTRSLIIDSLVWADELDESICKALP